MLEELEVLRRKLCLALMRCALGNRVRTLWVQCSGREFVDLQIRIEVFDKFGGCCCILHADGPPLLKTKFQVNNEQELPDLRACSRK